MSRENSNGLKPEGVNVMDEWIENSKKEKEHEKNKKAEILQRDKRSTL
jgi:hypothetical protein